MNVVDNLSRQFSTSELMQICEAVGLSPTSRWGARKLIDSVISYCKKSGIPNYKGPQDAAALLEDFLYVAGMADAVGNVVDEPAAVSEEKPTLQQFMKEHSIAATPDCYGYEDDDDPACKKCPLSEYCATERVGGLPPCFGLLQDMTDPQCKKCFEAPGCKPA